MGLKEEDVLSIAAKGREGGGPPVPGPTVAVNARTHTLASFLCCLVALSCLRTWCFQDFLTLCTVNFQAHTILTSIAIFGVSDLSSRG